MLPELVHYLNPRPPLSLDYAELTEAIEVRMALRPSAEMVRIEPKAIAPWKLLCYLADQGDVVLHGTGDPNISEFIPRQPVDSNPFGAQMAVYAASDGIWPMFYAILDRAAEGFSLHNGCVSFVEDGSLTPPRYFFSIEQSALSRRAFRNGFVYVLPKQSFRQDPQTEMAGVKFVVHHWASLDAVRPLAIISVTPEDFPFLEGIRGHDDRTLAERMREDPDRFPWIDEQYELPPPR